MQRRQRARLTGRRSRNVRIWNIQQKSSAPADEPIDWFDATISDEEGNPIGKPNSEGNRERLRIYKGHFEDHVAFDRQRHDGDWMRRGQVRNVKKAQDGLRVGRKGSSKRPRGSG